MRRPQAMKKKGLQTHKKGKNYKATLANTVVQSLARTVRGYSEKAPTTWNHNDAKKTTLSLLLLKMQLFLSSHIRLIVARTAFLHNTFSSFPLPKPTPARTHRPSSEEPTPPPKFP